MYVTLGSLFMGLVDKARAQARRLAIYLGLIDEYEIWPPCQCGDPNHPIELDDGEVQLQITDAGEIMVTVETGKGDYVSHTIDRPDVARLVGWVNGHV